ncbi:MAG: aminopeptidase P N-terminal domain-containing protein [Treponema sp.]|nr:aminopeptidase P N-terminal domain-containing protein [Treponema sp.]
MNNSMDSTFFSENRQALYNRLEKGSIALTFSGKAPRKTNDQYYPYFTERNFLYLTGVEQTDSTLMLAAGDSLNETLFIPPPDSMIERWQGTRVKANEATDISGIKDILHTKDFDMRFNRAIMSGNYHTVYLPLFKYTADENDGPEYRFVRYIRERFPHVVIKDLIPHMKALRLIKKPCEIEALREATEDTREGILAMMRASKPGMYEYQYKAIYDSTLMNRGILTPSSGPIICAGKNIFLIHYDAYTGQALDGDMVLNDVGARRSHCVTDVSRAWPCNGRFTEKQKLIYNAANDACNHAYTIIKPGLPMGEVDATIKKFCFERLKELGICKSFEEVGTYIWHGGAHHIGFDVHDVVAVNQTTPLAPGMVFCVDAGIYHEEWGIGLRLEDNCLVTETGCENLSASIPRGIAEVEDIMSSAR